MDNEIIKLVSKETEIKEHVTKRVIELLEEGNTVPFIARYRKEMTNGLDEVEIKHVHDTYEYALQLKERKEEVIRLIDAQDKLTEELERSILSATKLQRIEDLYRPYRKKRRTRATIAKEKGLEALAERVFKQEDLDVASEAETYFSEEHELNTLEDVLEGVNDIMAEWISDEPAYREYIRKTTWNHGVIQTELKKQDLDEKQVYKMYYEYSEPIRKMVSHRTLAVNRGEKEDVLRVTIEAPVERIESYLERELIKARQGACADLVKSAIEDSYKRLIEPSIEREIRNRLTEEAEKQAIDIFSENLKNLLLQPPLKGRMILGVDPGFRTGCKLAVVDEIGLMHAVDVIYPTAPRLDTAGSEKKLVEYVKKYDVKLIAIGNGTASRETEEFIANAITKYDLDASYIIVNEAGASVYSASELAREEFPDLAVEERSAVSIARRVQDPLAELVKIDPKSIGVGQYQHDVTQKELTESLSFVVETAVNQVGVNVNTASVPLLEHIAGLSKTTAINIIKKRAELGRFTNRKELKDVPRLGPKTYEQSIGFLRVIEGNHPLDSTPIHPESYKQTEALLKLIGSDFSELGTEDLHEKIQALDIKETADTLEIGELTLKDITDALVKPGRDPRDEFPQPILKSGILTLENLEQGMELQGTVRNVVDFGAFVDIGVGQDGLVHISKLSNRFVKHPMDVVSVGDVVTVWVDDVDKERGRVALTMKKSDK